jgi:hypothetical protein
MDLPLLGSRDVDRELTDEARAIMLQLILSWAKFESSLTQFLLIAFGTSLDEGSLLVGNMQTRDKLEKLKSLYKHHGMTSAAQRISDLMSLHKHYVDVRNAIAHSACLGMYRPKEDTVLFSAGKIAHGRKGLIYGVGFTLEHMILAIDFAAKATKLLMECERKHRRRPSKPPPEPPLFRILTHPSPRTSGKGKPDKQHP